MRRRVKMEQDLSTLRHSTSHVLADAVCQLFENVKLAIGPSIDDGFYYDFDLKHNFIPDDLKKIELKMKEIVPFVDHPTFISVFSCANN